MLDNGRTGGERNLFVWEIGAGGESRIRHLAGGFNELIGPSVPFSLKPGKWNQLRVTLEGSSIKCHINGELVNDAVLKPIPAICAVSTYDIKKREIVVKLVNATPSEQKTRISILGAAHVLPEASLEILTSAHARDENSFDHPFSVIPRRETFTGAGREFTYSVPACSAVVMRIKTRS
jgi:alpha-L-arabinofuranosidase